jgi:RimJ/RimL family protein N-acetyltransferase
MIDSRNYTAAERLRDGTSVTVRTIRPEDSKGILDAFGGLDRESIYTRFFTFKKKLTDVELRQLTDIDFEHVVALVVTTGAGEAEKLVGGGRYCSEAPLQTSRSAELAFITADEYRGCGIASLVLRHLVKIGRDQGLLQFEADVLAQNQAMLTVLNRSGLVIRQRREANVLHVRLSLKGKAEG